MSTQGSNYDLSRFGMEVNRASPRQADIMIVSGTVTVKTFPTATPAAKWVLGR